MGTANRIVGSTLEDTYKRTESDDTDSVRSEFQRVSFETFPRFHSLLCLAYHPKRTTP